MKIEKNIPIPKAKQKKSKYFWDEMEVGDSFYIDEYNAKVVNQVHSNFNYWKQKNKSELRITTRKIGEGMRAWLINKK